MFFCEGMAFVTYIVALFCFCYLFDWLARVAAWKTCFFFLFFMISPIWIEQFYFTMQIFPIAEGVLLLPVCLFLAYQSKKWCWVCDVLLTLILFSIYQTFAIVYIAGCIVCFLLLYYNSAKQNIVTEKFFWLKLGVRQCLLFIIGFAVNTIVTNKYFMISDYLTEQIQWGKAPIKHCLRNILGHIYLVLTGDCFALTDDGIFYTGWYSVLLLVAVVLVVLFLRRQRQAKEKILPFLAVCFLQTTPFLMTIYGGARPAMRAQFIEPFVLACNILLIFLILPDVIPVFEKFLLKNWSKYIELFVCLGSVFILIGQYYAASQQQYTDAYIRKRDEALAYSLEQSLIEKTSDTGKITKPVVFIGVYDCPMNNTFMGGDAVIWSSFNMNTQATPHFEITSMYYIITYMQSLGIPITAGSAEQVAAGRIEAQTMTIYPSEGSIRDMGDYVIVKLGDDPWYEEDGLPPVT